MSADSVVIYYGLKWKIADEEMEGVELRSDQRIVAARRAGLKHYSGSFDGVGGNNMLFVGSEIGVFGIENKHECALNSEELQRIFITTKQKLADAGFSGDCCLHIHWQPDS